MSSKHKIGWLNFPGRKGETWNPWGGCSAVSPGCKNCWACRQANRFKTRLPQYEGVVRNGQWTRRVNRAPGGAFYKPLDWRDPRAIFVCSMSDFFHEGANDWREHAWHIIYDTPQHLYLILTKRPERIPYCLPSFGKKEWPWPNVWLGASVENQEAADKRIPKLLRVPAVKRFLSLEPLLGPVDLERSVKIYDSIEPDYPRVFPRYIRWVIVGGESGPGARHMKAEWVQSIRDQCQAADVPFFFKQWGDGGIHVRYCSVKKMIGPLLDGKIWNELPS